MENQHRHIKGYRELSQAEIDLMNRIKTKGAELLQLQDELISLLNQAQVAGFNAADRALTADEEAAAKAEQARFKAAEPFRWASIGKTDTQTAIMALVRAVAQPEGV
jgi:response regulator of citrate/malate metabolism